MRIIAVWIIFQINSQGSFLIGFYSNIFCKWVDIDNLSSGAILYIKTSIRFYHFIALGKGPRLLLSDT